MVVVAIQMHMKYKLLCMVVCKTSSTCTCTFMMHIYVRKLKYHHLLYSISTQLKVMSFVASQSVSKEEYPTLLLW